MNDIFAGKAVSVTIKRETPSNPLNVGQRVRLKSGQTLPGCEQRIKNKKTVYRLLKKDFIAYLKVASTNSNYPHLFSATLVPANF